MAVDHVELVDVVEDSVDGEVEVRRRVPAEAAGPQGLGDGRDQATGNVRVATGEGRDVVTAPVELAHELVDDALGPAIGARRDSFHRRRDLGDAQRTGHEVLLGTDPRAVPVAATVMDRLTSVDTG